MCLCEAYGVLVFNSINFSHRQQSRTRRIIFPVIRMRILA